MSNPSQPIRYDVSLTINVPALDRLVTYLEGQTQTQIDTISARIRADSARKKDVIDANTPPPTT